MDVCTIRAYRRYCCYHYCSCLRPSEGIFENESQFAAYGNKKKMVIIRVNQKTCVGYGF